jgi:hypothetical protein
VIKSDFRKLRRSANLRALDQNLDKLTGLGMKIPIKALFTLLPQTTSPFPDNCSIDLWHMSGGRSLSG